MAFAWLCHFNRLSIAVAGTEAIMPQYGIDETSMGVVYSSYLVAYTLCMMPAGWLIDRIGPRTALVTDGIRLRRYCPADGSDRLIHRGRVRGEGFLVIRGSLGIVTHPLHPGAAHGLGLDSLPRPGCRQWPGDGFGPSRYRLNVLRVRVSDRPLRLAPGLHDRRDRDSCRRHSLGDDFDPDTRESTHWSTSPNCA